MEENRQLEYNTERKLLNLPEYGRNVQKMVAQLKTIEDRDKRNEQARAVIKVMELLNPSVHLQDDFEHKLWDHLFIIADFDLDVDSPYPVPSREKYYEKPLPVGINKTPVKATHYGRNIESILNLIAEQEDGEEKTALIRSIAIYMRQQYLIWNKDSVADETIFQDIEKLSGGKVKVPQNLELSKISSEASYNKPGLNAQKKGNNQRWKQQGKNNQRKK